MYELVKGGVRRIFDCAVIPADIGNADYADVMAWVDAGGVLSESPASCEEARRSREIELSAACAAAITAGITQDVTGEELFYPTTLPDQANLTAVVTLTLLGVPDDWTQDLTTRDAAGVWARRSHTAAQVRAVGRAVAAHVDACRARLADRRGALAAAGSSEEISAVVW